MNNDLKVKIKDTLQILYTNESYEEWEERTIDELLDLIESYSESREKELLSHVRKDMVYNAKCADCECNEINLRLIEESLNTDKKGGE